MFAWLQRGFRFVVLSLAMAAGAGCLGALILQVFAMRGDPPSWYPIEPLAVGIFALGVPVVFVTNLLVRNARQRDFWKIALSGCPDWMRRIVWGVWGYGLLVFGVAQFLAARRGQRDLTFVSVGAVLLIFYATDVALFVSAANRPNLWRAYRCPSGHPVAEMDDFCPKCGALVRQEPAAGTLQ